MIDKVGDKYVYVLDWISVIWGCYGAICVVYLLCYAKGIYELIKLLGGERYERDSVNVFYMGIYVGVWRGFDLK